MKHWLFKSVYPLCRLYWFLRRPTTHGVRVVVQHHGLLLAIRHTYGKNHWYFPGGGIKKHESPLQAAMRELLEEVGIKAHDLKLIGTFTDSSDYKHDHVSCFTTTIHSPKFLIDSVEIREAQWVSSKDFPHPAHPQIPRIVKLLNT